MDLFTLYYVITLAIELITSRINSTKFRKNGEILRLGSKFHGLQKTVGPNHHYISLQLNGKKSKDTHY